MNSSIKKIVLSVFVSSIFGVIDVQGLTLKDSILEVLNTNPIVIERLSNYRATQQDINIAKAEYLPKVDFRSTVSNHRTGRLNSDIKNQKYNLYTNSLKLVQNIFDGFHTTYNVNYEETRALAAAYNYLEKSNDVAFKMVNAYLNVLKNHEILENAKENVIMNKQMLKDIEMLYKAKLVTKSDVIKIQASLSMARTNLIASINNTKDTEFNFTRALGRKPIVSNMKFPNLNISMPESIQRAILYALKNNPSLIVSKYNIKGAQELYKRDKHTYYPKLDFELEQKYNDVTVKNNGFDSPDDQTIARLVLRWNLYNGGADEALRQKRLSKIHQEVAIKQDLKRQTIEGLELSWSAYEIVFDQIKELKKYSQYMNESLQSIKEQYKIGAKSKKTILDLLTASSSVINAKSKMISAKYDEIFAKYRILDAMGLLVTAVVGDSNEYKAKVNIDVKKASEVLDKLPIILDSDNDKVVDDIDICDNSKPDDKIMPYGCIKTKWEKR